MLYSFNIALIHRFAQSEEVFLSSKLHSITQAADNTQPLAPLPPPPLLPALNLRLPMPF